MGKGAFFVYAVAQPIIINNVIAAHKTCQVKGLAGGIQRNGAHAGIGTDRLGGNVLITAKGQIGPNFVGNHINIQFFAQSHHFFDLPLLPNTAHGVVGGAEDHGMDIVGLDLFLHVRKIHAPDALFILLQWGVDDAVAVIFQTVGEADIGGTVEQYIVAQGA